MAMRLSSRTNSNTSSISVLEAVVERLISNPRQQFSGSNASSFRAGRESRTQMTLVISPAWRGGEGTPRDPCRA